MVSFIPTPPIRQTALADVEKPPSKTQTLKTSTLTTKTSDVQPPQAPVPAAAVTTTTPAQTQVVAIPAQPTMQTSSCGDNTYANYIYMHESGCSTTEINSIGCIGIGQDCNNALAAACPSLDYTCENNFFTRYMEARYGSWEAAYDHEISDNWW